jgi:hypothetical protein
MLTVVIAIALTLLAAAGELRARERAHALAPKEKR